MPGIGDDPFDFACGLAAGVDSRFSIDSADREARSRKIEQGFAINFSVRGKWQFGKKNEARREHIIRELRLKRLAQSANVIGPRGFGNQISNQAVVALAVLSDDDDCLPDSGAAFKEGFDLAWLDAVAAKFDLEVGAPQELDVSVGLIPGQVAGAVDPLL